MATFFFTEDGLVSARWLEAFPQAEIHSVRPEIFDQYLLKFPLQSTDICWVLLTKHLTDSTFKFLFSRAKSVIALTRAESTLEARRSVEFGASGYLHYLAPVPLLMQAALVVEQGGLWLGADLMRQIVFATAQQLPADSQSNVLASLTDREKSVADCVAAGKTNKEIARELQITERTVKAHLSAIFEKLQVRDRLQLVLKMSGN